MCSRFWTNWSVKAWCVSLFDNLRKFTLCSWQERRLFFEACVLLGVMRAAILLLPFRKITKMMGLVQGEQSAASESIPPCSTETISWAIQAAAARTPWESACLVQALTGMAMMSRRGINATLYLGVAKDESGAEAMLAHAWLRCGTIILTGFGGAERFSAISSFSRPAAGAADNRRNKAGQAGE